MATQFEQGTEDWFAIRCGRVTASRVADIIAKTKSGPSASRANYAAQLVVERLTGFVEPSFQNAAMQWGIEKEAEARTAYCFLADAAVLETDFVLHPEIFMAGASPDGLVNEDGLVEIKCPNSATHIETLRNESIPDKYVVQMLWQMACTGRQWCDFVSYDPRFPEAMRLFVKRVERDDTRIAELELAVREFIAEVEETCAVLNAKHTPNPYVDGKIVDLLRA